MKHFHDLNITHTWVLNIKNCVGTQIIAASLHISFFTYNSHFHHSVACNINISKSINKSAAYTSSCKSTTHPCLAQMVIPAATARCIDQSQRPPMITPIILVHIHSTTSNIASRQSSSSEGRTSHIYFPSALLCNPKSHDF